MVRALRRQPDPVPDLLEIFPGSRDPVPDLSEICRKSPVGAEQAAQRLGSRKGRRLAAGRGAQLLWAAAWASGLHPGNQTPNCPRSPSSSQFLVGLLSLPYLAGLAPPQCLLELSGRRKAGVWGQGGFCTIVRQIRAAGSRIRALAALGAGRPLQRAFWELSLQKLALGN